VLIDDKKFDMDGIRTVVYGLVEAVRERLYVELMFADDDTVPAVDIGSLVDITGLLDDLVSENAAIPLVRRSD
jgi:hypothetical protein